MLGKRGSHRCDCEFDADHFTTLPLLIGLHGRKQREVASEVGHVGSADKFAPRREVAFGDLPKRRPYPFCHRRPLRSRDVLPRECSGRVENQPDGSASILTQRRRSFLLMTTEITNNGHGREGEASLAATWKSNAMTSILIIADRAAARATVLWTVTRGLHPKLHPQTVTRLHFPAFLTDNQDRSEVSLPR